MSQLPKTALIEEVTRHPQAHKLSICSVSDGEKQWTIVCGAQNVRTGMKSILAPSGSILPNQQMIETTHLRGQLSEGMLCSAKDLKIAQEEGIIDLPPETPLNIPWNQIPTHHLSSIPWHQFKLVEAFWDLKEKGIRILRDEEAHLTITSGKLISQTYFDGTQMRYRHFTS